MNDMHVLNVFVSRALTPPIQPGFDRCPISPLDERAVEALRTAAFILAATASLALVIQLNYPA
jgi:hypothetical protein